MAANGRDSVARLRSAAPALRAPINAVNAANAVAATTSALNFWSMNPQSNVVTTDIAANPVGGRMASAANERPRRMNEASGVAKPDDRRDSVRGPNEHRCAEAYRQRAELATSDRLRAPRPRGEVIEHRKPDHGNERQECEHETAPRIV